MHVDYDLQKVTVWGICNRDDVLAIIKKKRREARFWDLDSICQNGSPPAEQTDEGNGDEQAAVPGTTEKATLDGHPNRIRKPWKRLFPLSMGLR